MFEGDDVKSGRSSLSFSSCRSLSGSCLSLSGSPEPAPAHSKVSNKVAERHFSPRTRRLAVASKSHMRTHLVYHESGPFNPMNSHVTRLEFAWATVRETSDSSNDTQMKDAFRRA